MNTLVPSRAFNSRTSALSRKLLIFQESEDKINEQFQHKAGKILSLI